MSPESRIRSVRPRMPASVSAVLTAPAASTDGTGSRPGSASEAAESRRTMTSAPARDAASAEAASRSSATPSPAGPAASSHVASRIRTARCGDREPARTSDSRRSRSTTTGRVTRTVAGRAGIPPRNAGRRPSSIWRSMTARSRSGSIGGLVTWANDWRRWSATERVTRPRPASGVSSPMLHRGSCASSAIVRTSRRSRSASSPNRWRSPGPVAGTAGTTSVPAAPDAPSPMPAPATAAAVSTPAAAGSSTSANGTREASWSGRRRSTHDLASESPSTRRAPGSTSSSSPGASRPLRTISSGSSGTAPASEATATIPSAVSDHAAGRSPFRSRSAPTRRPSLNTNAAGPSQGATNPATRRRNAATAGCGVRRSAGASGTSASSAASSDQPVPTRSSSAWSSDCESDAPGVSRGPAARRRSAAARRRAGIGPSCSRPRMASRLPRTVLISPLWATNPNGWASDHVGCVLVAYRWWNTASGTSIGAARSGKSRPSRSPATSPLNTMVRDDAETIASPGRSPRPAAPVRAPAPARPTPPARPAASARSAASARRRTQARASSNAASVVSAGRGTRPWRIRGIDAAAPGPSWAGSTGTCRHSGRARPSAASAASTIERGSACPPPPAWLRDRDRCAGANTVSTPGRAPACPRGSITASSDGVIGSRMPAPSLEAPSAANAPRWPSEASPPSARARTRPPERPTASATNPTPQASCS